MHGENAIVRLSCYVAVSIEMFLLQIRFTIMSGGSLLKDTGKSKDGEPFSPIASALIVWS